MKPNGKPSSPDNNNCVPQPRVSVGMPVFNGADYIESAVKSILNQTFKGLELIISDNASEDETGQMCRRFVAEDPRIIYFRQPCNRGAAWNYNFVFSKAGGEFFKWAGHDDILAPEYLERCVALLDDDAETVLAYTRNVVIDAAGRERFCYLDNLDLTEPDAHDRVSRCLTALHKGMVNPVFGVARRAIFAQTRLHGDYIGTDRVLVAEFAMRGKIREVPKPLFMRRVHPLASHQAVKEHRSQTKWYTGRSVFWPRLKFWRWLREFIVATNQSGLSWRTRISCYRAVAQWGYLSKWLLLRELCLPLYLNGQYTALGRTFRKLIPGLT